MEKILGLDLGSRTCGIAMSDALGMLAHGVETYRFEENNYKDAAKHIQQIVEEHHIHTIVLGLPKHMNGDLGERAQISMAFKQRLEKMMDVEVVLVDERLTTVMAQNQLIFADVSRKKRKKVIDKMGNGGEEIKAAADYITTDVNDDGLYNAFRYLKLID